MCLATGGTTGCLLRVVRVGCAPSAGRLLDLDQRTSNAAIRLLNSDGLRGCQAPQRYLPTPQHATTAPAAPFDDPLRRAVPALNANFAGPSCRKAAVAQCRWHGRSSAGPLVVPQLRATSGLMQAAANRVFIQYSIIMNRLVSAQRVR